VKALTLKGDNQLKDLRQAKERLMFPDQKRQRRKPPGRHSGKRGLLHQEEQLREDREKAQEENLKGTYS